MSSCYIVVECNDGDYDHYEEWIDAVFEDLDDAVSYVLDELRCIPISEKTLFFKRRFENGSQERRSGEANPENGGQSVWIQTAEFYPNEWKRDLDKVLKSW